MTCFSCRRPCLLTRPYFLRSGSATEERHFCWNCERAYLEAKAARRAESVVQVQPAQGKRKRPSSELPFAMQLETQSSNGGKR